MSDTQHIVCPHCGATNRVSMARRGEARCGGCRAPLFDGAPHDVDEAVLLSDRIVMMTNGPAATIGEILRVDLPRPRDRLSLSRDPDFVAARSRVLGFLYERHDLEITRAALPV